jgi:hypothetical protein
MESALYFYLPQTHELQVALLTLISIGVLTVGISIFLLIRPKVLPSQLLRLLLPMTLFFVGIISLASATLNGLALRSLYPIKLYAQSMLLEGRVVRYSSIRNAYLLNDEQVSPLNPQVVNSHEYFLTIEENGGKVTRISEEYYPVQQILAQLKEVIGKASSPPSTQ